jgi:copper(I)-binding protein
MNQHAARLIRTTTVIAVAALIAAGCSDDGDEVTIDGAWARTSPMSAQAGAAYFEISSGDADVLIGASVDSSIAGEVQIHETTMVDMEDADHGGDDAMEGEMGDDAMEGGAMEGMGDVMQMREVGRIELPAGDTVELKPGGLHIMLLELSEPLEIGATFDLTLDFETAPDQVVTVEVRDGAPE